jgi:uncharacterized protein YutE (UPF0331/DUF86 family)
LNEVVQNKLHIIQRCLNRVKEEYSNNPSNLLNYTKQDAIILNIQRACQTSISLAMYIVSLKKWGLPKESREAFDLLYEYQLLDEHLWKKCRQMVGFRNLAIHEYEKLELDIIQNVVEYGMSDIRTFADTILQLNLKDKLD